MNSTGKRSDGILPRRVEVLAGLSVAIDLGLGQPAEHMLRSATIACRLAERLGLNAQQRATVYFTTLVMWIGCHADSQEYARWFGDDIAVRREAYLVDWSGLPYLRFLLDNVAKGEPLPQRLKVMGTLLRDARGQLARLIHSHCASASALARHIGLSPDVASSLAYTFERYDGHGLPTGASGGAIPVEMRIAQVADVAEVHHRMYGLDAVVAMAGSRRGGHFDPDIVDALLAAPDELFATAPDGDAWREALDQAPDDEVPLTDDGFDRLACVLHRIPGLDAVRTVARAHHEHVDGTGYPLGIGGSMLGTSERILAAAVAYQSALEVRPYRPAMEPEQAMARLHARSASGALDPECVDAVLDVAGHPTPRHRRDDLLTSREREVLGLVSRGFSNRQIADHLVLSEKTVRNHVEHTYTKIGATNRVGASLYALQHGLVTSHNEAVNDGA